MHEVLINGLGGLSLPRKSVVRLNDLPDMTLDVYQGGKTTTQQQQPFIQQNAVIGCQECYPLSILQSDLRVFFVSTFASGYIYSAMNNRGCLTLGCIYSVKCGEGCHFRLPLFCKM